MRRSKDLWILVLLFLLLGLLAVLTVMRNTAEQGLELFPRRTSYSARPSGVKALYLTLDRLGYRVRRHGSPLDVLPQDPEVRAVFVLSPEPFTPLASHEWRRLAEWVQAGRLACVAFDYPEAGGVEDWYQIVPSLSGETLPGAFGTPETGPPTTPTQATATCPSALTRDVQHLAVKGEYRFDLAGKDRGTEGERGERGEPESRGAGEQGSRGAGEQESDPKSGIRNPQSAIRNPQSEEMVSVWNGAATLYRDAHGSVVAYSAWGKGGFLLVSCPWLLSNDGLDEGDNLILVLNALDAFAPPRSGKVILFDEFHHGYGKKGTLWQVTPGLVRLGLVQVGVAVLVLLFGLSRRFAAPIPLSGEERSRAEYLDSMATLFQRARATPLVRQHLEENFRRDMAACLALGPEASDEQLVEIARHRNQDLAQRLQRLFDHLAQVKQMKHPPEEALLRLAAEMYALQQEVRDTI